MKMMGGCLRLGSGSRTSIKVAAHLGEDVGKAAGVWVGAEDLRRPWRPPCTEKYRGD